jgi:hypothetical protein
LEATASQKTSLFWEDMDQIKVVECMNGMLNMKQWQKTMVDHGRKFWSKLFFHTHIIASAVRHRLFQDSTISPQCCSSITPKKKDMTSNFPHLFLYFHIFFTYFPK